MFSSPTRVVPFGILLAVAGTSARALAQISPGPLARAHASLDGPLDCMKCHGKGERGLERQCLACHKEIAATIDAGRGLHGKGRLESCARCHPDHAGEDFDLISWEEGSQEKFDHSRAGFDLEGKHREAACRDCHNPRNAVSPIASLSPRTDRSRGFVGLETSCASCHEDPHAGVLGTSCGSCHDESAWTPAPGFDHGRTSYALTGRHASVDCGECHRAERLGKPLAADGRREPVWKPLAHAECSDCHDDPHENRLGPACSSCHGTESFEKTDREGFDHDRTRYPLRGRHRRLECASCHDEKTAWGAKPPFERCESCHEKAHGSASRLAAESDCGSCHTVDGFDASTITTARHAEFAYPLRAAHVRVACDSCHPKRSGSAAAGLGTAAVLLRPPYGRCTDCHDDPHANRFGPGGERPYEGGCQACHGLEAFRPADFGIEEHARAAFPLEGAHRTVPCSGCHEALAAAAGRPLRATLSFRETFGACADCHADPHGGQFGARADCRSCHDLAAFVPATNFDHTRLEAFALAGAHAGVACAKCHPETAGPRGERQVLYRPVPHACRDCHGPEIREERVHEN